MNVSTEFIMTGLFVFALAGFLGFETIRRVPMIASTKPISPAKMPLRAVLASDIHFSERMNPRAPARYSRLMIT